MIAKRTEIYHLCINLNKLSIKHQVYLKPTKLDSFEQIYTYVTVLFETIQFYYLTDSLSSQSATQQNGSKILKYLNLLQLFNSTSGKIENWPQILDKKKTWLGHLEDKREDCIIYLKYIVSGGIALERRILLKELRTGMA